MTKKQRHWKDSHDESATGRYEEVSDTGDAIKMLKDFPSSSIICKSGQIYVGPLEH